MKELFEEIKMIIKNVTESIFYFRSQNDKRAYNISNQIMNLLQDLAVKMVENGFAGQTEELLFILQMALEAMDTRDSVKMADVLEDGLMPLLHQMQESIFEQEEELLTDYWGKNRLVLRGKDRGLYEKLIQVRDHVSDDYSISWAKTGDLVLSVMTEQGMYQLNSACNPWREAAIYAESALQGKACKECVVVGFGMGYHIEMLAKRPEIGKIIVLENDLTQLAITLGYRDFSQLFQNDRLCIVYCQEKEDYAKWLVGDKNRICCIWYPSVRVTSEKILREFLEDYWIQYSSIRNMGGILDSNFESNIEKEDEEISFLQPLFSQKTMILAAAGPSLDDNLEALKNLNRTDTILVCVGKIARKLLREGIRPDYIVMIDGLRGTRWQIREIEDCGVPLLYLSTCASSVVDAYQGKRYIAFQEGFPMAEEYAKEHQYALYQSGGSVATFAVDLGIKFGCKKIVCVGLDMGYPAERTHASGVGSKVADTKNLRQVESVSGQKIYTNKTLDIYRQWIEKRISEEKKTEFINVSNGARIHGMKEMALETAL